jgi:hypothetical protein
MELPSWQTNLYDTPHTIELVMEAQVVVWKEEVKTNQLAVVVKVLVV